MSAVAPSVHPAADRFRAQSRGQAALAHDAFRVVLHQRLTAYARQAGTAGRNSNSFAARQGEKRAAESVESGGNRRRLSRSLSLGSEKEKPSASVKPVRFEETGKAQPSGRSRPTSQKTPEMPEVLVQLVAFLAEQPGGALKLSAERQSEMSGLLMNAGVPQDQVEQFMSSPRVQEHGVTVADIYGLWQRAAFLLDTGGAAGQGAGILPQGEAGKAAIELSREYQQRWEQLRLPANALPELKLELQRLGVDPQVLADLEKRGSTQGVPLTEVWKLLSRLPQEGQTWSELPRALVAASPLAGDELAGWRQLLQAAGLPPGLTEALLGDNSAASAQELTTKLLEIGPPPPALPSQETPKPLYLPGELRLGAVAWQAWGQEVDAQGEEQGSPDFFQGASPEQNGDVHGMAPPEPSYQILAGAVGQGGGSLVGQGVEAGALAGAGGSSQLLPYLNPEVREALWSQLRSGIISHLRPGDSEVVLSLKPPELGQVQLTLHLSNQQVAITAVTGRREVGELVQAQVNQLSQALSQQGLVLASFQVRPQEGASWVSTTSGLAKKLDHGKDKSTSWPKQSSSKVDRFA